MINFPHKQVLSFLQQIATQITWFSQNPFFVCTNPDDLYIYNLEEEPQVPNILELHFVFLTKSVLAADDLPPHIGELNKKDSHVRRYLSSRSTGTTISYEKKLIKSMSGLFIFCFPWHMTICRKNWSNKSWLNLTNCWTGVCCCVSTTLELPFIAFWT